MAKNFVRAGAGDRHVAGKACRNTKQRCETDERLADVMQLRVMPSNRTWMGLQLERGCCCVARPRNRCY